MFLLSLSFSSIKVLSTYSIYVSLLLFLLHTIARLSFLMTALTFRDCSSPLTDVETFIHSWDLRYKIPANGLAIFSFQSPYFYSALEPKWIAFCSLISLHYSFPNPNLLTSFLSLKTHFKYDLFSETFPESSNYIWSSPLSTGAEPCMSL